MKTIITSFIFCLSFSLYGQTSQEQIQLLSGEVIIGSIEQGKQFPYDLKFLPKGGKKIKVFTSSEVVSYWDDFQYFQAKTIQEGQPPVFLETLITGEVNLYLLGKEYYVEKEETFYKITKEDKEEGSGIRTDKKYIGMLKFLFFDCLKKSKKEWDQTKFNAKSLTAITKAYNDCKAGIIPQNDYTTNRNKLTAGVYVEAAGTKMAASGASFDDAKLRPSLTIGYYGHILSRKFLSMVVGVQVASKNGYIDREIFNTSGNATYFGYNLGLIEIPALIQLRLFKTKLNNTVFINGGSIFGFAFYKNSFSDREPNLGRLKAPLGFSGLLGIRVGLGYSHRTKAGNLTVNYFYEQNGFGKGIDIKLHGIRFAKSLTVK